MNSWTNSTLGDLAEFQRGLDLPVGDRHDGPFPVVAATAPVGTHHSFKVKGPGVVIGRSGSIGGGQFIESDFWPLNTTLWVKDFKGNDPRFTFYFVTNIDFTGLNAGSSVPTLNRNHIHQIAVRYPADIVEQRAIAGVLGALDDKIEQNRRTARALERLARAIFRAWFLDFEPVKAKAAGATAFPSMTQPVFDALPTRFVDSAIGPVPEGWEPGRLGDLIEIHDSRRIPLSRRQREERPGPYPYYGAAGIVGYVDEFLFDGAFVLVGEDGTVIGDGDRPVVQYVWGQFWVNNHAHVLTGASGVTTEHLRVLLDHINIRPFVTGAVQPKLNQGNLKSVPVVVASRPLVEEFGNAIAPAFQLIRQLEDESRKLAAMRDYLLPKLLGGDVRVEASHG